MQIGLFIYNKIICKQFHQFLLFLLNCFSAGNKHWMPTGQQAPKLQQNIFTAACLTQYHGGRVNQLNWPNQVGRWGYNTMRGEVRFNRTILIAAENMNKHVLVWKLTQRRRYSSIWLSQTIKKTFKHKLRYQITTKMKWWWLINGFS